VRGAASRGAGKRADGGGEADARQQTFVFEHCVHMWHYDSREACRAVKHGIAAVAVGDTEFMLDRRQGDTLALF
jgi:hypothetical protein